VNHPLFQALYALSYDAIQNSSDISLVIPYLLIVSSAQDPMIVLLMPHVSPSVHMESTNFPSPNAYPPLILGIKYGALDILSNPPARVTSD
jgi:hypothetical protein